MPFYAGTGKMEPMARMGSMAPIERYLAVISSK
jgi:hypothetical protein